VNPVSSPASSPVSAQRTPKPARKRARSAYSGLVGAVLATSAIAVGWLQRDSRVLEADQGLGYALGLVAVGCMLVLLVYPLRKRFKVLRFLGAVRNWFRTHMILGVLGPLAALFHCSFQLGSLNSRIALFSALFVAGSGLVGRFLYAKIHQGLYGRRTDLTSLRDAVSLSVSDGGAVRFLPELKQRMKAFDHAVLAPDRGVTASLFLLARISFRTRFEYATLIKFAKEKLVEEGQRSPVVAKHQRRLLKNLRSFVATHMIQVRQLAKLQVYDQLFALWHVVHLPFFIVLVITVVIHVAAVHLY